MNNIALISCLVLKKKKQHFSLHDILSKYLNIKKRNVFGIINKSISYRANKQNFVKSYFKFTLNLENDLMDTSWDLEKVQLTVIIPLILIREVSISIKENIKLCRLSLTGG